MRIVPILNFLGFLIVGIGIAMLTALPFSSYYAEPDFQPLLVSALISIGTGLLLLLLMMRFQKEEVRAREGFAIVTFSWIVAPLFGSLPFLLSGSIPGFTDAYFETISGFTTTGATILGNVEGLPKGLLYWRSLTQWLGGMGIIVLSLAILPLLGIGGMQLFRAEFAGPTKDKLTPRVAETARLLWGVYLFFTALETILLMAGGMSFFDAICHSFTTIASGGFSTRNLSIGFYNSAYIDVVVTIFMFIAGTSFALHFAALRGKLGIYFRDNEFVYFSVSFLAATFIIAFATSEEFFGGSFLTAVRHGAFNAISVMSSTGFATADFALWSPLAQVVLLFLMLPGACAGSTGGGMKNIRVLVFLKAALNELKRLVHPKAVVPIRVNGRTVENDVLFTVAAFIILYFVTFIAATIFLAATGLDIVTSVSAVAASLSNVGPGLGNVGPMAHYGFLTDFAKWVLSACMLVGRLEIFTVFILFSRAFWRS